MSEVAEDLDLVCLESSDDCAGAVELRFPLSGTGKSFPRCDRHWDKRLRFQEETNRKYGGDCAPSDFDPSFAGERWEED